MVGWVWVGVVVVVGRVLVGVDSVVDGVLVVVGEVVGWSCPGTGSGR